MHQLGLKYKKIKRISFQGNSEKSLILRQQWALNFLATDFTKKNYLSVDETWLGMSDFRRMHWRPYLMNCSVKTKQVQPRISMITAVDQLGNVFLCLTQSNLNKSMMSVFMEHFVTKLDKQNPHWRNSYQLIWDGAAYHRAKGTLDMLKRLSIPINMLGPYSYDAQACELFFAAFKKEDVNPNSLPLGKQNF